MNQSDTITNAIQSTSSADTLMIHKIAKRAAKDLKRPLLDTDMDLTVVHSTIGLNLPKLLEADPGDFAHDIFGIARYLNRNTGQLLNCFDPRCSS